MSVMVIVWQLAIFISIMLTRGSLWVVFCWVLWTMAMIYGGFLYFLQFFTIIIAYSVSRKDNLSPYGRGEEFSGRALSSYLVYLAGGTAAFITGFWQLAIGVSLLTNFGLETGRARYFYYRGLKKTVKQNEEIIKRLKIKLSHL